MNFLYSRSLWRTQIRKLVKINRRPATQIEFHSFSTLASSSNSSPNNTSSPRRLVLVDSASLAFRAFYGYKYNPTFGPSGTDISVLNGFAYSLLTILDLLSPTHAAVCMDVKGSNDYRRSIFSDYKSNRPPVPLGLGDQLLQLPSVCNSLGLTPLSSIGYEADDVIASVVNLASHSNYEEIYIVSQDKDFIQLCTNQITLIRQVSPPAQLKPFTSTDCQLVYDISPNQFVDYLALVGDAVDFIPGVPSIGMKTASKLLNLYGDCEGIIKAAKSGELAGKYAKVILEHKEPDHLVYNGLTSHLENFTEFCNQLSLPIQLVLRANLLSEKEQTRLPADPPSLFLQRKENLSAENEAIEEILEIEISTNQTHNIKEVSTLSTSLVSLPISEKEGRGRPKKKKEKISHPS